MLRFGNQLKLGNTTIASHIKRWNKCRIKSIKDHHGSSNLKLDAEIMDNLINVAVNSSPDKKNKKTLC